MDKPIRVLHVIGIMNRGGAETMIMNLYRHIDRSKVQFDFVENSSEPAIFDEEIINWRKNLSVSALQWEKSLYLCQVVE